MALFPLPTFLNSKTVTPQEMITAKPLPAVPLLTQQQQSLTADQLKQQAERKAAHEKELEERRLVFKMQQQAEQERRLALLESYDPKFIRLAFNAGKLFCCVCRNDIFDGEPAALKDLCNCVFHRACLVRYLRSSNNNDTGSNSNTSNNNNWSNGSNSGNRICPNCARPVPASAILAIEEETEAAKQATLKLVGHLRELEDDVIALQKKQLDACTFSFTHHIANFLKLERMQQYTSPAYMNKNDDNKMYWYLQATPLTDRRRRRHGWVSMYASVFEDARAKIYLPLRWFRYCQFVRITIVNKRDTSKSIGKTFANVVVCETSKRVGAAQFARMEDIAADADGFISSGDGEADQAYLTVAVTIVVVPHSRLTNEQVQQIRAKFSSESDDGGGGGSSRGSSGSGDDDDDANNSRGRKKRKSPLTQCFF